LCCDRPASRPPRAHTIEPGPTCFLSTDYCAVCWDRTDYGAVCWDRTEYGAVCWDSTECGAVCWDSTEYGAVCWDSTECGAVCWDSTEYGEVCLDPFANNINESGWETLAQLSLVARICVLFKAYTGERAWKAIGDRLLKSYYLSRDDHNRKIRTKKQRTDVGKYSFVSTTIRSWNQLSAGLLASFPCEINKSRKKNAITRKGIQEGFECK
jgi:hypothetical protein